MKCSEVVPRSKQLHKFEKESKEMGKASFFYAWVLDEGDDERSSGSQASLMLYLASPLIVWVQ